MPDASVDAYQHVPALVLGASGFIGRWVARRLTALGADVHVAVRDPRAMRALMTHHGIEARVWPVDLETPGVAARLCGELQPAVVFNVVGYGVKPHERSESIAHALNRALPVELARACERIASPDWAGQGLVHAGSALEYGPVDGPVVESVRSTPTTLYGRTKLAGARGVEEISRGSGLRAVEGRIFTAYGAGERLPRLLPTLLAARDGTDPLKLTEGIQYRDFVYVEDVAEGLVRLGCSHDPGFGTVNVATGTLRSVREFAETAARVLALSPARLHFGARPYRPEEMWHGDVSVDALWARLGWVPTTSLEDGIRSTVDFLSTTSACGAPGVP